MSIQKQKMYVTRILQTDTFVTRPNNRKTLCEVRNSFLFFSCDNNSFLLSITEQKVLS